MARKAATNKQLQEALDDVGEKLTELLNPALSREEIVVGVQELDELVNGSDDEEDEED